MRLPTHDLYPKSIRIGESRYQIRFLKRMKGQDGNCDLEKKIIRIRKTMSNIDIFAVFLHEFGHALAHEARVKISERDIRRMFESLLPEVLLTNFDNVKIDS